MTGTLVMEIVQEVGHGNIEVHTH